MIKGKRKFYGIANVGEKGQIVIPVEARRDLEIKKGDKLLIFGVGNFLTVMRISNLKKFADYLEKELKVIAKIIKKTK